MSWSILAFRARRWLLRSDRFSLHIPVVAGISSFSPSPSLQSRPFFPFGKRSNSENLRFSVPLIYLRTRSNNPSKWSIRFEDSSILRRTLSACLSSSDSWTAKPWPSAYMLRQRVGESSTLPFSQSTIIHFIVCLFAQASGNQGKKAIGEVKLYLKCFKRLWRSGSSPSSRPRKWKYRSWKPFSKSFHVLLPFVILFHNHKGLIGEALIIIS